MSKIIEETHKKHQAKVLVAGTVYRYVFVEGDTELEVTQNAEHEWSALTGGEVECAFVECLQYLDEEK